MNQPTARMLTISQTLIILLLLLSPALLAWQHFGMTRIIEISPRQPHRVSALDDHEHTGADSVASLVRTEDAFILRCQLGRGTNYPYCKLQFLIGDATKGVDLSQYDTIAFNIRYSGSSRQIVKLQLINFEPDISTVGDWYSQRYNEVVFDLPPGQPTFTIPFNVLRTAEWWQGPRQVPLSKSYTRFDNVTAVEVSTGNLPAGTVVTVELRSIQFHGKWISQAKLLMYLVSAWIGCGILGLSLSLRQSRSNLLASNLRLEQLATINKALELEARELAGQAHTDPLTGALNRQGLRAALMQRLETPAHYGKDLAVIFMDLDHFKQVNDRHGHDTGDEVLIRFAAVIRREVRAGDKLVRWGGEEFLLVCAETNREQAARLAEKLRTAMTAQDWPHGLQITCSFGATALNPEEDIGKAIARADTALYAAKSSGRNRVEVA
jgi:diguanylate cyclase (GGDEF)-like protein